mgnify:FL=1|uniref:Uncharacterized protein n=1 Tax=viral metagenome TaxID=1070528 RepID=A0A6C0AX29_9ZZZZ|tara:strand:+ start:1963 stop:2445 length:483 start_codon:yes stop_codon:yes gene_type:complete
MDNNQKILLKKLINENDIEDQTDKIRELKHSALIKQDIINFNILKQKNTQLYLENPAEFSNLCRSECSFLFTNYTDIYHKIVKGTLDLNMFGYFLQILGQIEEGNLDQHTASFKIGTLLKEMYVDSAIREGEILDKENPQEEKNKGIQLSWKQYKLQNNI